MNDEELIKAIAECHVEFIVIHPFREGNGRLGRVLSTVMALQADMPVLDFSILEKNNDRYSQDLNQTFHKAPPTKEFLFLVTLY